MSRIEDEIEVSLLDNVYARIYCEVSQVYELKEFFSCYAPNYRYHPKYKAHMWDGKVSFFDTINRTLPIGLLKHLKKFIEKYDYSIKFNFSVDDIRNDITKEDLIPFYDALYDGCDIYPRDYQQDAIYSAIRNKRGIIESSTGSGKSIIIYSLTRFMMEDTDGKILIVVPSINLVSQLFADYNDYGWGDSYDSVTLLYGKSKSYDPEKKVTISTWQSIYKKGFKFFEQFTGVLVDETHGAKSVSIQTVLKKCVNAEYKLGLTGTLPDEPIDKLNIFGYLGPTIYKLKSKTLIDKGFLANISIVNMHIKYSKEDINVNKYRTYAEEMSFIIENKTRNKVINYILDTKYVSKKQNVLVLAQRISHIDAIVDELTESYPNREILRIDGKTDPDERERIRKYIEDNDGVVLVATYGTLSTGVNIPKLHHVILASFYKSKIKVLQSIGRGLRTHDTKDRIVVWDLVDDMRWTKKKRKKGGSSEGHNYAYTHFLSRLEYYNYQEFRNINKQIRMEDL